MPHPSVCSPCVCPGEDCDVCLSWVGCGQNIAGTYTVYPSAACTGTPITSGSYDGSSAACFSVSGPGTYYASFAPLFRPNYDTACTAITVTTEDCLTAHVEQIELVPVRYNVSITVYGCSADDAESFEDSCKLAGVTVEYDDGTNTESGVTNEFGGVGFTGLDWPGVGTGYTLTLSDLGANCGWEDPTVIEGTLAELDLCTDLALPVMPDVATGYVCTPACVHPMKNEYTLTTLGGNITLTYRGWLMRDVEPYDLWSIWTGCGSVSCDTALVPIICPDDPIDAHWKYEIGTATIPFVARLILKAARFSGVLGNVLECSAFESGYLLEVSYPTINGPFCDPDAWQCGPVADIWCSHNNGLTYTAKTITCSGGSWVAPSDCEWTIGGYNPGLGGGVPNSTPICGGVTYDEGDYACDPCGLSLSGSLTGAADGEECMEDSYTLS